MSQTLIVFLAGLATAIATGLGALPLLFRRSMTKREQGLATALAAGLMLGASFMLLQEGNSMSTPGTMLGVVIGMLAVLFTNSLVDHGASERIAQETGANIMSPRALMLIGIMTAHSGAEGISIGVAYGDTGNLGLLVAIAMAIQNIPEGLAIALVLVPLGFSITRSALWAIFSSLPQPLMAVPAYLAVLWFAPLLPFGLGLAAGAMIWLCLADLLPEALENVPATWVGAVATSGLAAMLALEALL